jgi:hypothetical protein
LGEGLHEDIYLAAIWIEAVAAMRDLAAARGETGTSRDAARHYEVARHTLNTRYWRPDEGHHAFAILQSNQTNDNLTVWPATAMTFGQLEPDKARRTLVKLAADSISSDWGGHPLSTGSPLYDPMHYNNGAVWPFVTGFLVLAQYRYGRPWAGYPLIAALSQMTFDWGRGRHPEVLSGAYYRPLDTAVPQQFFATSMLVSPVMMGLLGWDPDAPDTRATLAPQLPPDWPLTRVHRLKVGDASVDATFSRMPGSMAVQLWATRGRPALTLDLSIPLGARDVKLQVDSADTPVQWADTPAGRRVRVSVPPGGRHTVVVQWIGGLDVSVWRSRLEPGQTSHGIRILDLTETNRGFELLLEGERGRHYDLLLHGVRSLEPQATGATAEVQPTAMFHDILRVTFPEGTGRATARVRLTP